ncbi:MAG: hypothetical protein RR319_07725 [Bacteroides sp.]
MKYNISLSIKSIIRAEQLLGKPFQEIDYANKEELTALLYCMVISNNAVMMTYEEFLQISNNDNQLKTMMLEFDKYNKIMNQFKANVKDNECDEDEEILYVKDVFATLIIEAGLDANFVLNEMPIIDLPIYITAYERKKKEQIENDRLWTYLTILPHVDQKVLKSAQDLYPLPWEIEERTKEAERDIKEDGELLEKFLKDGASIIKEGI